MRPSFKKKNLYSPEAVEFETPLEPLLPPCYKIQQFIKSHYINTHFKYLTLYAFKYVDNLSRKSENLNENYLKNT